MKPEFYLVGMLVIAGISLALTWLTGSKSAGKVEGIVATSISNLNKAIDDHKADTGKRIGELKDDFERDITELKDIDNKQWVKIGEHSTEIAYLKGRNTKANGAAQ